MSTLKTTKLSATIKDILQRFVQPYSFVAYAEALVLGLYLYYTPWTHSPVGLVVILTTAAIANVLTVHHDKWMHFFKKKN